MHDKNIEKKVWRNWEVSFKWFFFYWKYWQEPYLEPYQKFMIDIFYKNS